MANLKEIRNRIASVSSTMQITSAMKMVSAAKLKKAQDAITAMRPYAEKLTGLIQNLSSADNGDQKNPYTQTRPIRKVLLIAITSNRGLCGAFNTNIIKNTLSQAKNEYAEATVEVITIGKKGGDILTKRLDVKAQHNELLDSAAYAETSVLAQQIMDDFAEGQYDKVVLLYNQFKNAATQLVNVENYLPIVYQETAEAQTGDYIYEPNQQEIVSELLPKSLKIQLFKALKDSLAGEHGARMTAMHKATDNATELRDQLKLTYNKARQAAITNEILEIVGGAEALKG
jgi:F-type H+-transporting ATPase subunit gamma